MTARDDEWSLKLQVQQLRSIFHLMIFLIEPIKILHLIVKSFSRFTWNLGKTCFIFIQDESNMYYQELSWFFISLLSWILSMNFSESCMTSSSLPTQEHIEQLSDSLNLRSPDSHPHSHWSVSSCGSRVTLLWHVHTPDHRSNIFGSATSTPPPPPLVR